MNKPALVFTILGAYVAGGLTMWLVQRAPTPRANSPAPQSQAAATNPSAIQPTPSVRSVNSPLGLTFVRIDPGEFKMGDGARRVKLSKPFMIATTEVTQGQWVAVMGHNPSHHKAGDDYPVENITWNEALEFCKRLSAKEKQTYRLPTDAEWEYACRAGADTRYNVGDDEAALGAAAWYQANADGKTHPVAQKKPNRWGLYDMHGNVWEWCDDGHADLPSGDATDPTGDPNSPYRVVRSSSWGSDPHVCRTTCRGRGGPDDRIIDVGLRLVRETK